MRSCYFFFEAFFLAGFFAAFFLAAMLAYLLLFVLGPEYGGGSTGSDESTDKIRTLVWHGASVLATRSSITFGVFINEHDHICQWYARRNLVVQNSAALRRRADARSM